jgi:hypothetical protein
MRRLLTAIVATTLSLTAVSARADGEPIDYFEKQAQTKAVTVTRTTSRTVPELAILWGLVGAGAVGVGLGVRWHLDSRDAADAVSANDERIVGVWTDELMDAHDRAATAGNRALAAYVVGTVFLAGAFGWAFWTRPRERQVVLVPVEGGAAASAAWRF